MKTRKRIVPFLYALLVLVSFAAAASPTSFCKCTCGSNSTIIPLGDPRPSASAGRSQGRQDDSLLFFPRADGDQRKPGGKPTCSDCNRVFCLEYRLPICKGKKEEEVFTTCFQRDSRKDEAVVFIFIFATVGLLIYAAVRPWVNQWMTAARERRAYIPVTNYEDE